MALSGRERIPTTGGGQTIAASVVLSSPRRVPILGHGEVTSKGTDLLSHPDWVRIPLAVAGLFITVGQLRAAYGVPYGVAAGVGAASGAGVSVMGGGGSGNGFQLEDASGRLLLETGDTLLLEAA